MVVHSGDGMRQERTIGVLRLHSNNGGSPLFNNIHPSLHTSNLSSSASLYPCKHHRSPRPAQTPPTRHRPESIRSNSPTAP